MNTIPFLVQEEGLMMFCMISLLCQRSTSSVSRVSGGNKFRTVFIIGNKRGKRYERQMIEDQGAVKTIRVLLHLV